jgi:hypothetical protein
MTFRHLRPLAVALGLAIGTDALAQAPAPANQQLADSIASRLTGLPEAQTADVSLACNAGVVTVTGTTRDDAQKKAILNVIRVVPGVKQVRDGLTVSPIVRVQGIVNGPVVTSAPSGVIPNMPSNDGPIGEPVSLGGVGMPTMGSTDAPPLPPYAWPTYAPHNNVSRVAYPTAYPANAFPFIGPFYPFPKVPLGWRSVKLEWDDGHWWLGRTSTPQDHWRVRFW